MDVIVQNEVAPLYGPRRIFLNDVINLIRANVIVLPCYGALEIVGVIIILLL